MPCLLYFQRHIINFNVGMIFRQGCYSAEGSIVVLCGYLGQLAKVRNALSAEMVVLIDERDQKELADREGDIEAQPASETATVSRVRLNQRVRIS